jgi:hypothetical protein
MRPARLSLPRNAVAITFDDGCHNYAAAQTLAAHGLTATFTGRMPGRRCPWLSEIRKLHALRVERLEPARRRTGHRFPCRPRRNSGRGLEADQDLTTIPIRESVREQLQVPLDRSGPVPMLTWEQLDSMRRLGRRSDRTPTRTPTCRMLAEGAPGLRIERARGAGAPVTMFHRTAAPSAI